MTIRLGLGTLSKGVRSGQSLEKAVFLWFEC